MTMFFGVKLEKLLLCGEQTLYMIGWSLLFGTVIGATIAVLLFLTRRGGLKQNVFVYSVTSFIVSTIRSIPFVILLVAIMPFTRAIIGTTVGSKAALVPLIFYVSPYMARLIENSLLDVSPGIIEAAVSMGASPAQIVLHFLLPETMSSIVLALTTGAIGLLGASAMAGYVGGGGIGDLALTYGYQRFNTKLMISTCIILIVCVQVFQGLGNYISRKIRQHK